MLSAESCGGLEATIIGTENNDIINGTQGDDVIVGLAETVFRQGEIIEQLLCRLNLTTEKPMKPPYGVILVDKQMENKS